MLTKTGALTPLSKFCQNFCSMAAVNATKGKMNPSEQLAMDNMTKRGKKKLRRYVHQKRIEKKTVSPDEIQQLPSYCEENLNETDYYHQNGLRKVYPYYYTFSTYVKGRWMGRTILDIFTKEFHSYTPEYYKWNIETGRVTVNGEKVTPDFILGNNQLLEHTCHRITVTAYDKWSYDPEWQWHLFLHSSSFVMKSILIDTGSVGACNNILLLMSGFFFPGHENPIKHSDLEILVDNDEVLVVNKPSSWPIHPCGRYRYNSLTHILQKQYGYKNLRGLYRLDRLTSGLYIMAKTAETAAKMFKDIEGRNVQKEYVARVVGRFPDGIVECKEPLSCISYKMSIYKTGPKGKESLTTFERLSFNGKTSVVKCMPHTGRTHQIRVHLQYLGHPIVNDSMYNSEAFGPSRGKGGLGDDVNTVELEKEILKHHDVGMFIESFESPLYIKKQETVKKKNLESTEESNDNKLVCSASSGIIDQNEIKSVSDSADLLRDTAEETECEPQGSDLDKGENTGNSSLTHIERNKTVSKEVYDFNEISEPISEMNDGPPEKRVKINTAEDAGEEVNDMTNASNCSVMSGDFECIVNVTEQETYSNSKDTLSKLKNIENRTNKDSKTVDSNKIDQVHNTSRTDSASYVSDTSIGPNTLGSYRNRKDRATIEEYNEERMYDCVDICCQDCKTVYIDPKDEDLVMYLHAYRYKGSDWEYSTPLPDWAEDDWQE